jgi:plasmid stabilization system protein ParE
VKVIWSPLAEQRAIEAVDFIAKDRPQAAADWLEELIARVEALGKFAKRGRVVPEIGKATHRHVFHYPYRIIYRIGASEVVILTIRHGRRAWDPDEAAPGA